MPARPTTSRSVPAASTSSVTVVAERMIRAWAPTTASSSSAGDRPRLHVDLVAGGAEAVEPAVGDLFGDEDAGHRTTCLPPPLRRRQRVEHKAHRPPVRTGPRPVRSAGVRSGGSDDALAGIERWFVERGLPTSSSATTRRRRSGAGRCRCSSSPTCCSASTRSTCGDWSAGQEPRRRRRSSSPALLVTWVVANRLRGRRLVRAAAAHRRRRAGRVHVVPAVPSLRRRAVGRRPADGGRGRRHARRAVGDHQLRRAVRCCAGPGSGPRRSSPLLLNVVVRALPLLLLFTTFLFINAEVWQVAGTLTGVVYVAVLGIFFVLGAVFVLSRVPALMRELNRLRLVGRGRRRSSPTPRPTPCCDAMPRRPGATPAADRPDACASGSTSASSRSSPRRSRSRSSALALTGVLRPVRLPRHPRGRRRRRGPTLDDVARARPRGRRRARRSSLTEPLLRVAGVPRRVHRHVLHRRCCRPTRRTARSSPRTSPRSCAKLWPCAACTERPGPSPQRRRRPVNERPRHPRARRRRRAAPGGRRCSTRCGARSRRSSASSCCGRSATPAATSPPPTSTTRSSAARSASSPATTARRRCTATSPASCPASARTGLGRAMKLHQRAWAADHGLAWVTWTFDPLVRRNAWFNLDVLGAQVHEYLVDFYGPIDDAINAGDESDRLLVAWPTRRPVRPRPADARRRPPGAVAVPTPEDIVVLRRTDPAAADGVAPPGARRARRPAGRRRPRRRLHPRRRVPRRARRRDARDRASCGEIRLPLVTPFRTSFGVQTEPPHPARAGRGRRRRRDDRGLGRVRRRRRADVLGRVRRRRRARACARADPSPGRGRRRSTAADVGDRAGRRCKGHPMAKAALEMAVLDAELRAAGASFADLPRRHPRPHPERRQRRHPRHASTSCWPPSPATSTTATCASS